MPVIHAALAGCVGFSWLYWLLCADSARRWRRSRDGGSDQLSVVGHQSAADPKSKIHIPKSQCFTPPISILKPLCGDDPELYENLRSFCVQEYPEFQVVFGALDADDPSLEIARKLQDELPDADIAIVSGGEVFGANLKVCNLEQMRAAAKHDLLALSDSDMRVEPHYLQRIAAPFANPAVGLVTCPYRAARVEGLGSSLEALGIGADFMPSVMLTRRFWGMRFAFGSTIALRAEVLEQMGGFRRLADELADDYLVGNGAWRAGWRVELSDYVVDNVLGRESFKAMWTRRLRWARTTRGLQPLPYFGSVLTHGFPIALMFAIVTGLGGFGLSVLAATVFVRALIASIICGRYARDTILPGELWLLPFSDMLSFGLWVGAYLGNSVEWRGVRYRMGRGGRLTPVGR